MVTVSVDNLGSLGSPYRVVSTVLVSISLLHFRYRLNPHPRAIKIQPYPAAAMRLRHAAAFHLPAALAQLVIIFVPRRANVPRIVEVQLSHVGDALSFDRHDVPVMVMSIPDNIRVW